MVDTTHTDDASRVREKVRVRYAAAAVAVTSGDTDSASCCGPDAAGSLTLDGSFGAGLYAADEVEGLPGEALAASLGCGNPMVVASLEPGDRSRPRDARRDHPRHQAGRRVLTGRNIAMSKVLFVCVRNGGKSPMAAALLRHHAGPGVEVDSAGTDPGSKLNAQSVQALAEVGADMTGHVPQQLTPELIAGAGLIVVLGQEAQVEPGDGTPLRRWETDEPSLRGIEGIERMRLIRDDIDGRVRELATELNGGRPGDRHQIL